MLDNLGEPPATDDVFRWADFLELRAVVHPDRRFSRGDFVALSKFSFTANNQSRGSAESRWNDALIFIDQRIVVFGDVYPFRPSDDRDTLEILDQLTPMQRLYLNLLVGANMRYIKRSERSKVARSFEELSLKLFKKILPMGSRVKPAWAAGDGENGGYVGTLKEKFEAIAVDIRAETKMKDEWFHQNDRGDGGIDLVAWHPMGDDRESIPAALAQCGCSATDWKTKQLSASPAKLRGMFLVLHPWANFYFMPIDLRLPSGGWAHRSDLGDAIIVDRLRLMKIACEADVTGESEFGDLLAQLPTDIL
jgi:hypothetical protein